MYGKRTLGLFVTLVALLLGTGQVAGLQDGPQSSQDTYGYAFNYQGQLKDVPQSPQATAWQLGPEVRISEPTSPEADRYKPAIAYNWIHREYLVVWHNTWPGGHRDVYARRVSESGKLLSLFTISAGANNIG